MSEDPRPLRDYVAWHDDYLEPGSRLHRRLQVVIRLLGTALDAAPAGPCRVVSLCAGQGDDVLAVAATHPRGADLAGRLVELDPQNASAARDRIDALGLDGLGVLTADAGTTDAYVGAVPADLVVACGIFGNITWTDIAATIAALPSLCAPDASVVWTRYTTDAEVFEAVQRAFADAGFERVEVDAPDGLGYGVGLHRLVRPPDPFEPGRRLFTFIR